MCYIYKITNIVLIFMLIGAIVCQDIAYAASNLRANLMFNENNQAASKGRFDEAKNTTLSKSEVIERLKIILAPFKPDFKGKNELSAVEFEDHLRTVTKEHFNIYYSLEYKGILFFLKNSIYRFRVLWKYGYYGNLLLDILKTILLFPQGRFKTSSMMFYAKVTLFEKPPSLPVFTSLVIGFLAIGLWFYMAPGALYLLVIGGIPLGAFIIRILLCDIFGFDSNVHEHELQHFYTSLLLGKLSKSSLIALNFRNMADLLDPPDYGLWGFPRKITPVILEKIENNMIEKLLPHINSGKLVALTTFQESTTNVNGALLDNYAQKIPPKILRREI